MMINVVSSSDRRRSVPGSHRRIDSNRGWRCRIFPPCRIVQRMAGIHEFPQSVADGVGAVEDQHGKIPTLRGCADG